MKIVVAALFLLWVFPLQAAVVADDLAQPRCLDCHFRLPFEGSGLTFNEGIGNICSGCHKSYHGSIVKDSHPDSIIPSMTVPRDMPLDIYGAMTCITCHTYHVGHNGRDDAYEFFLRRSRGKSLCYSCHKKRLY